MTAQIQEVYAELGQILDRPRSFGLWSVYVPQPLAETLRSMRCKLRHALNELQSQPANRKLTPELSQNIEKVILEARSNSLRNAR